MPAIAPDDPLQARIWIAGMHQKAAGEGQEARPAGRGTLLPANRVGYESAKGRQINWRAPGWGEPQASRRVHQW